MANRATALFLALEGFPVLSLSRAVYGNICTVPIASIVPGLSCLYLLTLTINQRVLDLGVRLAINGSRVCRGRCGLIEMLYKSKELDQVWIFHRVFN